MTYSISRERGAHRALAFKAGGGFKSETADVFAMRLRHDGAMVGYKLAPNPNIPPDFNILTSHQSDLHQAGNPGRPRRLDD